MRPIDADIVIKDLTAMKRVYDAIDLDGMIKGLQKAKTITLDDLRPHGRWIGKNSPYDVNIHICSVCREQVSILGNKLRYCPNCGAEMDGSEDQIER